jgi:dephospho-CoA kinase
MVTTIVAISGAIGSGKTSVAYALKDSIPGADVRSFGNVVREVAEERGRGSARSALQETGEELIKQGWPAFVDKVLDPEPTSDVLVVDGIRHLGAVDELRRRWSDARFVLVYIKPSTATIDKRLSDRGEDSRSRAHPVESELPEVLERANLVLVDDNLAYNVGKVLSAVGRG